MPLRKLGKTKKTSLADGPLPAPAAEGWEAAGGGDGGETAQPPAAFDDGHHDDDDDEGNNSDSGLLPSRSQAPGGVVVTAKNSSFPGRAVGEPAQQEAKAGAGAEWQEQEAMESGERGEEALTEPLLVSSAPGWS